MLDYHRYLFPSGLRLITVPMAGVESVTVLVGVGSGSRDEPALKAGLSHFLEHMASKGTKKRPTPFKVASVIDSIGGEQNAGTSKEFTEYWVKVASPHLEIAFDFLADNLKNPLLAPAEIEKERRVIIEEINMYEDLPTRRILDIFESLIYGKTPLGRDISGDKKTVGQIKREDFFQHLKKFYRPQNLVVVAAGKFSSSEPKQLTKKYFSDLKRKTKTVRKKPEFTQAKPRLKLVYKKTDQAHFCFGVPGVNYSHPDRFVVAAIASILGYSRTSRIYRGIREKRGWAYYVHTVPEFYTDAGTLYTGAGVSLDKIQAAIRLVRAEYFRLTQEKVGLVELKRAKDFLKGRFILALEDSFNVASRYAIQEAVEGKLRKPEEVLALIDKVSAKDILRVSRALFQPKKLNLALIGPYRNQGQFKKLLT
jgi:predicted Zn-dependent peptidase